MTIHSGEHKLSRLITPAYGYLSSHEPAAHFGLGESVHVDTIEVKWPGGLLQTFAGASANQTVVLKKQI